MRSNPCVFRENLERESMGDCNPTLFHCTTSNGNRVSKIDRQAGGRNRNDKSFGSSLADDSSPIAARDSGSYGSDMGYYHTAPVLHDGFGNYSAPVNTNQSKASNSEHALRQINQHPVDYLTDYSTSTDTRSRNPTVTNSQQPPSDGDTESCLVNTGELYVKSQEKALDDGAHLYAAGFATYQSALDDNQDWESLVDWGNFTCNNDLLPSSNRAKDPSAKKTKNPDVDAAAQPSSNGTATPSVDSARSVSDAINTVRVSGDMLSSVNNVASDLVGNTSQPTRADSAPARSSYVKGSSLLGGVCRFIASDTDDQPLILQQIRAETRSLRASSVPPLAKAAEQTKDKNASNSISTAEVQHKISTTAQELANAETATKVSSSTTFGVKKAIRPSLTTGDFANLLQSGGFQTDGQPFAKVQLSADVQQSMVAQIAFKDMLLSKAFSQLENLEGQVAQFRATIRNLKAILQKTTPVDARPLGNDTTSIDLSKDPFSEANARSTAQSAPGNAPSRPHVNPANTHTSSGVASSMTSRLNFGRLLETGISEDSCRSRQSQIPPLVDPSLYHLSGGSFDQPYTWPPSYPDNSNYLYSQDTLPGLFPMPTSYASTMQSHRSRPSHAPDPVTTNAAYRTGYSSRISRGSVQGSGCGPSTSYSQPLGSSRALGTDLGKVSASRCPSASSPHIQNRGQKNNPASRQPFSSSSKYRGSGIKALANTRPSVGIPTPDFFSGFDTIDDVSFPAHAPASRRTRQAPTNQTERRKRRVSFDDQAATSGSSAPRARVTASSRSNGPTDTIEGMLPGVGVERLLGVQRVGLPKGNVNGLPYSCEAKCGYPDYAVRELVGCDSAFHRKQPHLQRVDGLSGERGWYHPVCGGLPADDFKSANWTCPACISNGRTSTDDHDYDEGGENDHDDKSGPAGEDDSEDDYEPGPNHSNGNSKDGGNDSDENKYDGGYTNNQKQHNKGTTHNKDGTRKRYASYGEGDEYEDKGDNAAGSEHDQVGDSESDDSSYYVLNTDNGSDPEDFKVPTAKGDPWSKYEKALAIYYFKKIDREKIYKGEARFGETSRLMQLKGFDRNLIAVKNIWNRCLRKRSGLDERRNKRAPLRTSQQDKETKRKNREKKKKARLAAIATAKKSRASFVAKRVSLKRKCESDDEDEVIPPKRRRVSPHNGDYSAGLS